MSMDQQYEWCAITTRYKCEKYVADRLTRKGIEVYVPLLTRTKRYVRKIKTYRIPLISCYVFVRMSKDEYVSVLETQHVVDFVRFSGEIACIRQHEIQLLKRVVGEAEDLSVEPKAWIQGDRVEIISGSLTGIQGILTRQQGRHEFVVELDTLGFQMRMTVDQRVLRRLGARVGVGLA